MTDNEKPEPQTFDCTVTYSNSEARSIKVVTQHFVDGWYMTTFEFRMTGSTAVLFKIRPPGSTIDLEQSKPAWNQARETVKELPFVQAVEML
jgi:hypothetical protein